MDYEAAQKKAITVEWEYKSGAVMPKEPILYQSPVCRFKMPFTVVYCPAIIGKRLVKLHNGQLQFSRTMEPPLS